MIEISLHWWMVKSHLVKSHLVQLLIGFIILHNFPRFPSLEDCYDIFDEIFTPTCSSAKIDTERNIHICASSTAGDICNGDLGSGLVILDKLIK